jgi:polar amino acid transport system ATP-binding protein
MTAVLDIQGVTKAYGERTVLRGIDLQVAEHAAVALIGASGSGKSTLLRCIDLLEEIDDGDILLDGKVITDPSVEPVGVRRRLGMVFQAFNLFPHLTALENVVLAPVRAHGMAAGEAEGEARELLARFGLAGREEEHPDRLSGGQQQRVAIARALVSQPTVLFADEPTGNLDSASGAEILALLREAVDLDGQTTLMVTHDAHAAAVADRVVFIADGRIVDDISEPTEEQVLAAVKETYAR